MPLLSFGKKKPATSANPDQDQRVFSVLLSQKTVQALFWMVRDGYIEIVSQSELKYYFDENDCLIKLDECLQELGPESETVNQALFHLDAALSDSAGLLPEKKGFLKHLTTSLSLTSIGVAANTEALEQVISQDVPKPYNLIIEFTNNKETWSLFGDEQLIWQKNVPHSAEPAKDFNKTWEEVKHQMPPENLEQNVSALYVSSIYNRSELLSKSEYFPATEALEVEYIGASEILERVVPPSAVALAKEKGWYLTINEEEAEVAEMNDQEQGFVASEQQHEDEWQPEEDADWAEEEALEPKSGKKKRGKSGKDGKPKNGVIVIIALVAGLVVTAAVLLIVLKQTTVATVTVFPKEVPIQKATQITIDPSLKTSDIENLILAGQLENQSLSDVASAAASGTKEIGEKSQGKVEIVNKKSTSEKKFAQGTILSGGDVTFVLNNEVTVPAVSTEEKNGETVLKHSKKDVNVTAVDPGEKGNIDQGAKLKVADFSNSDYEAEAAEKFSGGTSEKVSVATETDQTKLQAELQKKIIEESDETLKAKKTSSQYFIPLAKSATVKEKIWTPADLEEETDTLTLKMTVTMPVVSYEAEDLKPLAQQVLVQELPTGYVLSDQEPQLMSAASNEQKVGDTIKLEVDVRSTAVAQVNTEGMAAQVVGLAVPQAESKIRTSPGVEKVEVEYSNQWYKTFFSKLPGKAEKIVVQLSSGAAEDEADTGATNGSH